MASEIAPTSSTITSIRVQLGFWETSEFIPDGSEWNTYNSGNWAVGVTAPGPSNPLLDGFQNVNLPGGEYWFFMASDDDASASAIQIGLGYSNGAFQNSVFTAPGSGPMFQGPYTEVLDGGFTANLVSGPQTDDALVGQLQTYAFDGTPNWIVDVNASSPEPASWMLLAGVAAALGALRKVLHVPSGE